MIEANILDKFIEPDKILTLIRQEKQVEKQLILYDKLMAQIKLNLITKDLENANRLTEPEKEEIQAKILGVFGNNNHGQNNRKKVIASS